MATKVENVQPIKDKYKLHQVEETLRKDFQAGTRNLMIFRTGIITLLRCSDVLSLKMNDIYDENGYPVDYIHIKDQKTGKQNDIYIKPLFNDLIEYRRYRLKHHIKSIYLFPSIWNLNHYRKIKDHPISRSRFYNILKKVSQNTGIRYLGTHTMRKTGAYIVYQQTHNIAFVMHKLNHSNEGVTMRYLGIDNDSDKRILDSIKWNL
ncbi:site-specific integrase [Philodulcilactobacillus myokoensis]|uniref:Site-specific integrase n=1 Tax=Philodulcilactobacillus myokoensis TaxID=2929573 RepID=A0A9W6B270_9LACO|nr:tyrosine-type recombinase/integrase [Philodulcilactobacillus myokoensis]GLB47530.1 site-specific integrase [Philodulcilactobacillus myokoensis]